MKGDVASTKSELEKTVADLKRATGELDGHSVLIATNRKNWRRCRRWANATTSNSPFKRPSNRKKWATS